MAGPQEGVLAELWRTKAWRLFPLLLVYMSGKPSHIGRCGRAEAGGRGGGTFCGQVPGAAWPPPTCPPATPPLPFPAGITLLVPHVPGIMADYFAGRRAGHELHCEGMAADAPDAAACRVSRQRGAWVQQPHMPASNPARQSCLPGSRPASRNAPCCSFAAIATHAITHKLPRPVLPCPAGLHCRWFEPVGHTRNCLTSAAALPCPAGLQDAHADVVLWSSCTFFSNSFVSIVLVGALLHPLCGTDCAGQ
jgi:hypothetical protein